MIPIPSNPIPRAARQCSSGALLFSGLLTMFPAAASERCSVNGADINLDNGSSTARLTGTVKCVDRDSGAFRRELTYVDGRLHGVEKVKGWLDGRTTLTEWRQGRKNGSRRIFTARDELESETPFVDDREHGTARAFFASGKLRRETDYAAGEVKLAREFNEQGELTALRGGRAGVLGRSGSPYANFSGNLVLHHEKGGRAQVLNFKDGLLHGTIERYAQDGALQAREQWQAGRLHGFCQGFQSDGRMTAHDMHFANGRVEGKERDYFPGMAQVAVERDWVDGILTAERRYFQNGQLSRAMLRELQGFREEAFFDDGQPKASGLWALRNVGARLQPYEADWFNPAPRPDARLLPELVREGLHRENHPNGKPRSETRYAKGRREGSARAWHDNGQLASESTWQDDTLLAQRTWSREGKPERDETYFPDGSRKLK